MTTAVIVTSYWVALILGCAVVLRLLEVDPDTEERLGLFRSTKAGGSVRPILETRAGEAVAGLFRRIVRLRPRRSVGRPGRWG